MEEQPRVDALCCATQAPQSEKEPLVSPRLRLSSRPKAPWILARGFDFFFSSKVCVLRAAFAVAPALGHSHPHFPTSHVLHHPPNHAHLITIVLI